MFGVRPICGSVVAFCTWFTSGIRFYCGVLCSITPAVCLLTNRTACGMLRFYSAGSRSPFARSRDVGAVICLGWFTSGLYVSLWRSRRDCRGHGGCGERGYGGLAARPLCSFAQPHWLCCAFRGEYAGAARPRLRQRVFDSLDSLHAAAGLCWCKYSSLQKAQVPQSAHPRAQNPGTWKDLTGFNLWPVRSGCIAIISTRTIGDLPDSDLWSGRSCIIARQQVSAGTAGRTAVSPRGPTASARPAFCGRGCAARSRCCRSPRR